MKKSLLLLITALFSMLTVRAAGFTAAFDADINAVDPQGKAVKGILNGTPELVPGLSGKALLLDRKELRFPAAGNIDLTHGAVSFWIKPENWGDKNVNFLPVFTIDSSDRGSGWKILFYYHRDNAGAVWDLRVLTPDRKEIVCQTPVKDTLKLKEWNHITISWTNQEIEFSINGNRPVRQTYGLPIKLAGHRRDHIVFMPEKFWRVPSQWQTGIDEIEVFSRPLTAADVKTIYLRYRGNQMKTASAVIPELKKAVKIDGKIDLQEWSDATRLPVVTAGNSKKLYSGSQAWAYVKADAQNLYVAFDISGKDPVVSTGEPGKFNKAIFAGDKAEFVIYTGKNNFRQYFIAPNGSWGCLDYEKRWQEQSTFRHAAVNAGNNWSAEMAIPLAEIAVDRTKPVSCNFGIHRKSAGDIADLLDRWISWSSNPAEKSVEFQKNSGIMTFAASPVRVESIGNPAGGDIRFSGSDKMVMTVKNLFDEKSFELHAGENKEIAEPGLYSMELKKDGFYWAVTVEKQELFSFDFECDANNNTIEFGTRILERPDLIAAIGKGNLQIKAVVLNNSGELVASAEKTASGTKDKITVKFNSLDNGRHILQLTLAGLDTPVVVKKDFIVPDRSFLGNNLGIQSEIPAPWSEVKYEKNDRAVTAFHKYDFAGDVFPVKAWSFDREVLTSSSGILVECNGKVEKFLPAGGVSVSTVNNRLVRSGVLKNSSGDCKIIWKGEIDFDGFIYYTLTLQPQEGKKVKISLMKAVFNIPAQAAVAALMPDFSAEYLKNNFASSSLFAGTSGDRAGFSVFTHDDTNYVYNKGEKSFQIRKKDGGNAAVSVNFISHPVEIDCPVEFSVCVMATPGKPPRADWRILHSEGWMAYPGQNWAIRGWTSEKYKVGYMRGYLLTTPANPDAAKAEVLMHRKHGISDVTYTCNNLIPGNNPIHDYFAKAWARPVHGEITRISQTKEADGTPYFFGVPVCANHPGYRDYLCYYIAENMDKSGFKGVYFDFGGLAQTDTSFNGVEIKNVLSRNRQIERENLFGVRELYKRLRNIIKSRHADGMLYIHCWRAFHPGVMSFVDTINPGEEFMHTFPRDRNVYIKDRDASPPEVWRTSYNSQAMGAAVQFLAMLYWIPEMKSYFSMGFAKSFQFRLRESRAMLTMCLLHDVQISGGGYAAIDGLWPRWDALEPDKAVFHGYFEQQEITASNGAKVSFYSWEKSDRKLIVIANLSGKAINTRLTFKGDIPAKLQELWPEERDFAVNGDIPVEPYGFRLLVSGK
ncbi:MAG: hypothetical protein IKD23_00350 [Lentisphaeria bacterium]|nr:hypothetical protein [Lentisphaeria bacterium]